MAGSNTKRVQIDFVLNDQVTDKMKAIASTFGKLKASDGFSKSMGDNVDDVQKKINELQTKITNIGKTRITLNQFQEIKTEFNNIEQAVDSLTNKWTAFEKILGQSGGIQFGLLGDLKNLSSGIGKNIQDQMNVAADALSPQQLIDKLKGLSKYKPSKDTLKNIIDTDNLNEDGLQIEKAIQKLKELEEEYQTSADALQGVKPTDSGFQTFVDGFVTSGKQFIDMAEAIKKAYPADWIDEDLFDFGDYKEDVNEMKDLVKDYVSQIETLQNAQGKASEQRQQKYSKRTRKQKTETDETKTRKDESQSSATTDEASAMDKVSENAKEASDAKKQFAQQNQNVASSARKSAKEIGTEAAAFDELIKRLSKEFSSTNIDELKTSFEDVLNTMKQAADVASKVNGDVGTGRGLNVQLGSDFVSNIQKTVQALSEFLTIYKQINNVQIDTSRLETLLKDMTTMDDEGLQNLATQYPKLMQAFNTNGIKTAEDWQKMIASTSDSSDYANNIIKSMGGLSEAKEQLGDLLQIQGKLKTEGETTIDLSSLEKADSILGEIRQSLISVLQVLQRFSGVSSTASLEKIFSGLNEQAASIDSLNVKLSSKEGKKLGNSMVEQYEAYLKAGGQNSIDDLTASKRLKSYMSKRVNTQAESMGNVQDQTNGASEAKSKFAEANAKVLSSAENSVKGLEAESAAFKNINKFLSQFGGDDGASKIEGITDSITKLISALNTPVDGNSAVKSIETISQAGDNLKNLATVLSATKKQIDNVKKTVDTSVKDDQYQKVQDLFKNNLSGVESNAESAVTSYFEQVKEQAESTSVSVKQLQDLLDNFNDPNVMKFNSQHNDVFGLNELNGDDLRKKISEIEDLKRIYQYLTKRPDQKLRFVEDNDGDYKKFLSRLEPIFNKVGYNLGDIQRTSTKGFAYEDIIPTNKAITNVDQLIKVLFNLKDAEESVSTDLREPKILNTQIGVTKDGLIQITSLVETLDGKVKELTLTSKDGQIFDFSKVEEGTTRIEKQLRQYEKFKNEMQNIAKNAAISDDEMIVSKDNVDADTWQKLLKYAAQYKDEIGEITQITRQVRKDAQGNSLISYSIFGDKGGHITTGKDSDIIAASQIYEDLNRINSLIQEIQGSTKQYIRLTQTVASGDPTDAERQRLQDLQDKYTELISTVQKFNAALSTDGTGKNPVSSAAQEAYNNFITKNNSDINDIINTQAASLQSKILKAQESKANGNVGFTSQFSQELDEALEKLKNIKQMQQSMQDGEFYDPSSLSKLLSDLSDVQTTVSKISDKSNQLVNVGAVGNLLGKVSDTLNNTSVSGKMRQQLIDIQDQLVAVKQRAEQAGSQLTDMDYITLGKLNAQFKDISGSIKAMGQDEKSFSTRLGDSIKSQTANFLSQYFSIQDYIRYIKEIFTNVNQVDSALIELQKVSDASNDRIQQSFQKSADTAQELGATLSDVINSTADWSRLNNQVCHMVTYE